MTTPVAVPGSAHVPAALRMRARVAVGIARVLMHAPPARIRAVLTVMRRGARPSAYERALAARMAVVAVSARCCGPGCLQRSLATALLCRMHGEWPTWVTGVRMAPFRAHAWVEAEGRLVDEPYPAGYFVPTMTVPPA